MGFNGVVDMDTFSISFIVIGVLLSILGSIGYKKKIISNRVYVLRILILSVFLIVFGMVPTYRPGTPLPLRLGVSIIYTIICYFSMSISYRYFWKEIDE